MFRPAVSAMLGLSLLSPAATQSPALPAPDSQSMEARAQHWAWQPLTQSEPPSGGHPVDAFVGARLRREGLAPAAPAAAEVQLRRLWFDLIGLPPTPEAVRRFAADPTDAAWRREVDGLLKSQHFGERWGRHWLDLMRYCETLGHEFDYELPNAWRYRDYVIRALNADVPYDQFVREHIAGDLLPEPRRAEDGSNESVQATASWWFPEQTHSPVDAMQHQADRIDNQIDVFGKAFLGMTVACARCHDHKFDAIPTRDYYGLFGFVQSSRYVQAPLNPVATCAAPYQAALHHQRHLVKTWGVEGRTPAAAGYAPRPEEVVIADAHAPDEGWYRTGDAFGDAPWRGAFCANPAAEKPRLIRLQGPFWLSGAAGPRREGTIATRSFKLRHRYVHVRAAGQDARLKLIVDGFHVVRSPIYGELHKHITNPDAHWVTFDVEMWPRATAFLQAIDQRAPDLGDPKHNRGAYPDDAWIAVQTVLSSPHPTPPETTDPAPSTDAERSALDEATLGCLAALHAACEALPVSPTIPAMADGSGIDGHVYIRGDHDTPGEDAPRGFLSAIPAATPAMPTNSSGRLELAETVVSPGNPLPARVMVNRVWHHMFGRGIVASVDNFGALGDRPTHPALLDWLARDLIRSGWSIKHAIRQVATSAAYRQSSRRRADAERLDAQNLLLHRQNVRPLEAETVRDTLLSVSGSLDPTLYGRSVEQPSSQITKARGKPGRHDPLDGHGRRSVYLAVRRNFMNEMMLAFDQPTPFATVGRRNRSNVPAQALALANAPLVHELCGRFAERVIAHSSNDARRLEFAYLLAFGRTPHASEIHRLLAFVADADDERATWFDALHALLNTTEFRFRR